MAKRRRLPDLADDHRCTRNGTNWRCHLPRLPNKSYCQKHHLFNLTRSQSNSKRFKALALQQNPNPNPKPNPHSNLREIWAFHQPPSNCPDLYARIDRLVPAKWVVEVTPLVPIGNLGCGFFRVSETSEGIELGRFSHRVWFEMEGEMYKIFPRKGEVWVVERYGWVEMVSSFGEGEGASGIVLVEGEIDEEGGVYQRRLYEGCELIRRFSMEEMGMFKYRATGAKVVSEGGSGGLGLLEGCTSGIEEQRESNLQSQEYYIEDQAPDPILNNEGGCTSVIEEQRENNLQSQEHYIEDQTPDPILNNEGGNTQSLERVSIAAIDANEMTLRATIPVGVDPILNNEGGCTSVIEEQRENNLQSQEYYIEDQAPDPILNNEGGNTPSLERVSIAAIDANEMTLRATIPVGVVEDNH